MTKIIAGILAAAVICCVLPAGCLSAKAGEMPAEDIDPNEEISLHIQLAYTGEKENYPLKGAGIDLYRVAELVVHGGAAVYTLTDDFADSGLDLTEMTASESMKAAEKLASIVKQKNLAPIASGESDAKGELTFPNLVPGIYLGVQAKPVTVGDKYKVTCGKSLWLAPMYELKEDGGGYEWVYACSVQPKAAPEVNEITPDKPVPPKPKPPVKPSKTRTGDETPVLPYAIMFGTAALCLIFVICLDRKKSSDH